MLRIGAHCNHGPSIAASASSPAPAPGPRVQASYRSSPSSCRPKVPLAQIRQSVSATYVSRMVSSGVPFQTYVHNYLYAN